MILNLSFKQYLQDNNAREEKRRWNMVVDTTSLLNKESRKALQLLQGLKGTYLIIPRIGNELTLAFPQKISLTFSCISITSIMQNRFT